MLAYAVVVGYQLKGVCKLETGDRPWKVLVLQTCALQSSPHAPRADLGTRSVPSTADKADASWGVLGRAWYDRRIGVRVHMLGEPGTTVFAWSERLAPYAAEFIRQAAGNASLTGPPTLGSR